MGRCGISNWNPEPLKRFVQASNQTHETVAKNCGISCAALEKYLRGDMPNTGALINMADYFAVPLDVLTGRVDEETEARIFEDYGRNFMELRRKDYENSLAKSTIQIGGGYSAPWPYNLLDEIFQDPENARIITRDQEDGLEKALETLTDREWTCVIAYFKDGKSLDEIAADSHVSKERIRQIICKAVRKLRHPSRKRCIQCGPEETRLNERAAALDEREARLAAAEAEMEKSGGQAALESVKLTAADRLESTPIDRLGLTVRSYNCLARAGYKTAKDALAALKSEEKVRNLGLKSIKYDIIPRLNDAAGETVITLAEVRCV